MGDQVNNVKSDSNSGNYHTFGGSNDSIQSQSKSPIFINSGVKKATDYGAPTEYMKLGLLTNGALGLSSGTNNDSLAVQIAKLPKTKDGTPDINKIKEALNLVIEYHKGENQKAYDILENYGMFSKTANGENGYTAYILGPELTKAMKENGILGEDIQNFLKENDNDAVSFFPTNDDGDGKGIEVFRLKSSQAIKADIQAQNEQFAQLVKSINAGNIEQFLNKFQELTGTTFDYNGILNTQKLLQDPNTQEGDKLGSTVAYFGESMNLVQATKNQVATEAAGHGIMNTACGFLTKAGPVGKIVGNAIPLYVNTMDTLSKGTKEGQWINTDNFTWDNFWEVTAQTGIDLAVINTPGVVQNWAGEGLRGMFRKMGISTARNLSTNGTVQATKKGLETAADASVADYVVSIIDPTGTVYIIKKLID